MDNVLQVDIDPDIKLDPDKIKNMPEDLQGHLRATLTMGAERYDCHWTKLAWSVKFDSTGNPYIRVKPR